MMLHFPGRPRQNNTLLNEQDLINSSMKQAARGDPLLHNNSHSSDKVSALPSQPASQTPSRIGTAAYVDTQSTNTILQRCHHHHYEARQVLQLVVQRGSGLRRICPFEFLIQRSVTQWHFCWFVSS